MARGLCLTNLHLPGVSASASNLVLVVFSFGAGRAAEAKAELVQVVAQQEGKSEGGEVETKIVGG